MQATLLHVKSLVPPFGIHKHTVRVLPSATTKSSLWFYSAYHLLPPLWMHAAKMKECLRSTAADTRGKCVGLKKPECCWNVLLAYTSPLFILGFFFSRPVVSLLFSLSLCVRKSLSVDLLNESMHA